MTRTIPRIPLRDGTSIPQLGLGTWRIRDDEAPETVLAALELGYRHVDTAQMYGNESGVGKALAQSGLPREELYVTTKLDNPHHRPDDARRELAASLDRLGLERVDLFLVHWPMPTRYEGDFVTTWRTLAEFVADGRVTSIGVSNFQPAHLDRIVEETGVVPVVNQVEVHPFFANEAVRSANRRHGVVTEAWSPIAKGRVGEEPLVREIADLVGRTPVQVALRWHVQRGDVVFPKTSNPRRMRENLAIFDFDLSETHMRALAALDRGEEGRLGPHPDTFG